MVQKMRKMKDSGIEWIGEIPEGWEVSKLKYLGRYVNGYPFKPDDWGDKGKPIIRIQDLTGSNDSPNYYDGDIDAKYHIKNGDILVSWAATLDAFIWNKGDGLLNQHIFKAIPQEEKITSYFFFWMIKEAMQNMNNDNKHGIFMQHVTLDVFNNFSVPLPPLSEQKRIATYLFQKISEADIMLDDTLSSITGYKKLKQAVITQAVTKGVRGEREMKDSGVEWIGEIPKEWVCEKIKYATSISRGLFNHRPRNDERYYNGKYPFIQTGDVANATKYIVSYSQTLNELGKSVSKEFPKGTLTMTIAANVGDVAILNFDAYFPDSVVGFIPNKNIRTLYLFYVFSAMKDEFTRTAIKSTQLNLNIDRVKETFIPVTHDSNEQCEIENYLESKCAEIDGLIAKKEQLVKELESYKKSLIYEVVTGKREV